MKESRDNAGLKAALDNVLHTAAGQDVDVADAFRIGGRYVDGRPCPVLVKLRSAWTRRVVINGARKLSTVDEYKRSAYISPDEPLEIRRRNTMERLKKKATRTGKTAMVSSSGIIHIDDVPTFSLKD